MVDERKELRFSKIAAINATAAFLVAAIVIHFIIRPRHLWVGHYVAWVLFALCVVLAWRRVILLARRMEGREN